MSMCPRCRFNHPMVCRLIKKRTKIVKLPIYKFGLNEMRYLSYLQEQMDELQGALNQPIKDEKRAASYIAYHNSWAQFCFIRFGIQIPQKKEDGRDYERMEELIDKVRMWRLAKDVIWLI